MQHFFQKGIVRLSLIVFLLTVPQACKFYSFTGADIDYSTTNTFNVRLFENSAPLVEPGIARDFTIQLQDLLLNQTSLDLVTTGGDLIYEGEIVEYYIAPITATAQNTAAQNRLTITVNVRFYNTNNSDKDFERRFSFYFDYAGGTQLTGARLEEAVNIIFERLTQDIFNASLANW
ncbi:LptE family protein [Luteirhabdus pelagi]|uniref:LptE family protein n=1 Tax=Luteirhabdus pelagi TaxID=2792783 RepID=UPI00193A5879|nr:LptE family protein [Luteirhabdus pelagi]